jgi:D-inositol-3-phosphate glycosyltransferase
VGGLSEAILNDRSGYIVEPDPAQIAERIADYFNHAREQQMVASIAEHKRNFSWRAMVEGIEELFSILKNEIILYGMVFSS